MGSSKKSWQSSFLFVLFLACAASIFVSERTLATNPFNFLPSYFYPYPPLLFLFRMQSDDVIWSVINAQFCSYKVK